jgi:hypothetical protein
MRGSVMVAALLCFGAEAAVVLDRLAVTLDNRAIKDSDINRDIRVTSFINAEPLEFTNEARRKSAERLIDQMLIRAEVQVAQYPEATPEEVEKFLDQIRAKRFTSAAAYAEALKRYGITEEQLRKHLAWQLTVLTFIEQRFRPGVLVSDEEVEKYFQENRVKFRQTADAKTVMLEDVRDEIVEQIAGERVNHEFFDWLERARSRANIRYREAALK